MVSSQTVQRPPCVVNESGLAWQEETSPDGRSRFFRKKLAAAAGGREIGCSLYRIPPHKHSFPRHYHAANEEAIYVLSGAGTLLVGDAEVALRAGDYAALPVGPEHVHKVLNDSDQELVFLCFSTMVGPDVVVYPDSGKVGVFAGSAPGGPEAERVLKKFFPLHAELAYWEGE